MIDEGRMNSVYGRTILDIQLALSSKTTMKNRILAVESAIERYHEMRHTITGRYNNQRFRFNRKNKRLLKDNRLLREKLSKRWWQFW